MHISTKFTFIILMVALVALDIGCQQHDNNETLWTVAWSPDGKYIAAGGNQDALKLFNASTFELEKTFDVNGVIISRLKWHPFENKLAVITQSETFKAKILDLEQDKWKELAGLKSGFRAMDWNYSGELLAVSELERKVAVYDINGNPISRFTADPKGAAGLDWHPNKNILTTVGSQIGIYTSDGDTILTFTPRDKETFLLCIEWHNSGDFFVVGDYGDLEHANDKLLQFWDIDGKKLNEIEGSVGEYRNIRWSPDGEKLASASDALRIWSKDGHLLEESKSSEDYLWGVDWSPDGKYIVTTSSIGIISIRDNSAKLIKQIKY